MRLEKLGLFIVVMIISYFINTYYFDKLLKVFNIISVTAYILNRVSLALFLYCILELIFFEKKQSVNLLIYKFTIIYFIWLTGLLFGRIANLSEYNLSSRFNFVSFIPKWINHLDNKLVLYYLIGNVLVYIPIGLIFRYFKSFIYSFIYCFLLILLFETLQAVTNLGYFDIDDIILNSIGALMGILFMHLYKKIIINH